MPEMTSYTHGVPCWADLATPDTDAAKPSTENSSVGRALTVSQGTMPKVIRFTTRCFTLLGMKTTLWLR